MKASLSHLLCYDQIILVIPDTSFTFHSHHAYLHLQAPLHQCGCLLFLSCFILAMNHYPFRNVLFMVQTASRLYSFLGTINFVSSFCCMAGRTIMLDGFTAAYSSSFCYYATLRLGFIMVIFWVVSMFKDRGPTHR